MLFLKILYATLLLINNLSVNPAIENKNTYLNNALQSVSQNNKFLANHNISNKKISILLLGDLILGVGTERLIVEQGLSYPFKKVQTKLKENTITFANLEAPITNRGTRAKNKLWTFRSNPDYAKILSESGIDVVSLANNHIMDFGETGLKDTIETLKSLNIRYSGAGKNLSEARKPTIVSRNGTQFVFLSYCQRGPASYYAGEKNFGNAYYDKKLIAEDIKKWKTDRNVVLISLHWGIEITNYPQEFQISDAKHFINAGADGIIGHHPHIPQGIQIYKGKPIIYSLGNFIVGFYNKRYQDNIAVRLNYKKNRLKKIDVFSVAGKNEEIHYQPYFISGERMKKNLAHLEKISENWQTKIYYDKDFGVIFPQSPFLYLFDEITEFTTYFLKRRLPRIAQAILLRLPILVCLFL